MASSADIRAGRAFVELYVRDYAFRQRLLEDQAMFEDITADMGRQAITDSSVTTTGDAYAELERIADQSLETLYHDTLYLTEATTELLDVLNEVMDTYLGLGEMQQEGITLSAGQQGIAGPGGEAAFGFAMSDMKAQIGEGFEGIPEAALLSMGKEIGKGLVNSDAGRKLAGYIPFIGKSAKQGLEQFMPQQNIADVGEAPIMAELVQSGKDANVVMAELVQSTSQVATVVPQMATSVAASSTSVGLFTKAMGLAKWAVRAFVTTILPLLAVLAAAYAAFKAFQLAVAAVKLPFQVVGSAVNYFVSLVKQIPKAIGWAVDALKRLTVAAYEAARSLGSAVWSGVLGTFRMLGNTISAIGSTVQATGKGLAYLGGGMAALGALITVPLTKAAQKFGEMGSSIKLLTEQYRAFGLTAEQASVYAYAASQASGMLGQMGEAERIQYLMRTMKTGTAEYEKWRKQAEMSGSIMSGEALSAASALTAAYRRLTQSLNGLWATLGAAVAPAITDWTELVVGAVRGVTAWARENQQLIATAFRVATSIGTVGTVIAAVGTTLMGVGAAISPLTAILAAIAGGMAVVEYRTRIGASLWESYSNSVMQVYRTVVEFMRPIVEEVQKVIKGVTDAIKGGDLALAARIAWSGLKLAWMEGLLWLSERTGEAFGGVLKNLAAGNWKNAADGAMAMLKVAFLSTLDWLDGLWVDVRNAAGDAFTWIGQTAGELYLTVADKLDPMWLWLKKMFGEMKMWAQAAFEEVGIYAAGFSAAFADIAGKMKPILYALAALNPGMAGAIYGAIKMMSLVKDTAVESFDAAVTGARLDVERRRRQQKGSPEDTLAQRSAARRTDAETRVAGLEAANDQAKADRAAELDRRREQRTRQIAELEAQAARGGSQGAYARQEADRLRQELATLEQEAEDAKDKAKQPDLPQYLGKTSGLVSASAFAFGSLGMGGGSVAEKQLDIQRKTWEDARKKEVEERKRYADQMKKIDEATRYLQDTRDRMNQMGIFGAP